MATLTPKTLVEGTLLPNAVAAQYTAPAATTATIRTITLCNTDSVDHTVTLHLVASGGVVGPANMVLNAMPIKAGETIEDEALRELMTGASLRAFADVANMVSMRVDGSELA